MPNWVYNNMRVTGGTSEQRQSFAESLVGDPGDGRVSDITFGNIIPRPSDKEEDWYNWNIQHWGTKWDAGDVVREIEDDSINYSFSTPWAPPMPIYQEIATKHPHLSFEIVYEEEQGWGGTLKGENGTMTSVKEWDIPSTHEEIVSRGGQCYCEGNEETYFSDCFPQRAKSDTTISERVREAAVSLGFSWEGSYAELVQAAKSLSAESHKRTPHSA